MKGILVFLFSISFISDAENFLRIWTKTSENTLKNMNFDNYISQTRGADIAFSLLYLYIVTSSHPVKISSIVSNPPNYKFI